MRFRRLVSWLAAIILLAVNVLPVPAAYAAGPVTTLYPTSPILSDTFNGAMAPFVPNDGLTPGGVWLLENHSLVAEDYGIAAPRYNQIAAVPDMPLNIVLKTTFTVNKVNPDGPYRIGLFGHGSYPGTGASQWDLVFDHGSLTLINQWINYPASIPFPISDGQTYHMLMVIDGNWVGGKVWAAGTTEPDNWTLSAGFIFTGDFHSVGVAAGNADVTFHSFYAYAAPPSLTVTPAHQAAVFYRPLVPAYDLTLQANSPQEGGLYYVHYLVSDLKGASVASGSVPVHLIAGGKAGKRLVLPIRRYGYYTTTFSLTTRFAHLQYHRRYPALVPGRHGPPPGWRKGYGPPGHELTMLPASPGQPAVPARDLALSRTPAPVENTTAPLAVVPDPVSLNGTDAGLPFGINGPGNRFGPITPALEQQWVSDYRLLKKQGIQWVRTEFMWNFVEPSPGTFTWNSSDGLVTAGHAAHVNLLGLLDYWGNYANPFAAQGGPQVSFPVFVQDYDQFIRAVVARYMPGGTLARQEGWHHYGITAWEVWNEPSTPQFWPSQNPAQYAELVRSAAAAIQSVDPQATVLAYTWHRHTLVQIAGPHSFTGLSVHYYPGPSRPSQAEFFGGIAALRAFLTQSGIGSDPIWMTESGWSSNLISVRRQAQYLQRAEVASLAATLDKFFMFTWYYPGSGFGELDAAYQPKPVYVALAVLDRLLAGYRPAPGLNPLNLGSAVRGYVFTDGRSSLVVVWAPVLHGTLTLPQPANIRAYDWMGNPVPAGSGGLTVPLDGSPVFLTAHLPAAILAGRVKNGLIQGIPPVAITVKNLSRDPSALPDLHVTVTDQINRPAQGQLQLQLPSGWEAGQTAGSQPSAAPSASFGPVTPGASQSVSFVLDRFQSDPSNLYTLNAQAAVGTGTGSTITEQAGLTLSVLDSVYGHPGLTGSFSDWSAAAAVYVNQSDQNVGIPDWNPGSESTVAYTMWNHQDFYFAAKVKAPVFYEPYTGSNIWQGDSVQLFWDPEDLKTAGFDGAAGDADLGIARTPDGPQAFRWNGALAGPLPNVRLTIVPGRQAGDMWYEAAVPWADLPDFPARAGHRYGFDFLVNYNFGLGRVGWMWLAPGVGNAWSPATFPTFTMVRSLGLAAVRLDAAHPSGSLDFVPDAEGAILKLDNNGVPTFTVSLGNGAVLHLVAQSGAGASVTPAAPGATVPVLPDGTTRINLVRLLTPGHTSSLTISGAVAGSAGAVAAVDNGVSA